MTRRQTWALGAATLLGLMMGLGLFTFGYARGASYLTDNPEACANCHVMNDHFAGWSKSSHRAVATCNDCHTPHNAVGKYLVKAENGFWHSLYFTTGRYPDPLRIRPRNARVTEAACRSCHADIVAAIDHEPAARRPVLPPTPTTPLRPAAGGGAEPMDEPAPRGAPVEEPASCVRCHTYVGHWVR